MSAEVTAEHVKKLCDVAAMTVEIARRAGADDVEVLVSDGSELTAKVRMGAPELVQEAQSHALGLRLQRGGRRAVTFTSDLRREALEALCAETVALAKVSSEGRLREVAAIAVIGGLMDTHGAATGHAPVSPCGRCRQVINEAAQLAGIDLPVICGAAEGDAVASYRLSELLPAAFGPADLGIA